MVNNPYQVLVVKHPDGERIPILLEAISREPVYLANEYILCNRRARVASSTLTKDLYILAKFLCWGSANQINIVQRLLSGEGFTIDELAMSLLPWLRKSDKKGKVVKLVASNNLVQYRMDFIKGFINWHMHKAISHLSANNPKIQGIQAKLEAMQMAFTHLKLRGNAAQAKEGLTQAAQQHLLKACHPEYENNPWHANVKYRNYLIILLFLSLGIRRGELLKLYVNDCLVQGLSPELRVQRRPDDMLDPRRIEPNVKTESRILPLNNSLARVIDKYVKNERRLLPEARKHPYLIVSRKGEPMALHSINAILAQIGIKHPEYRGLHPHLLRHSFNTRLREQAREKGLSDTDFEKNLKYINGWKTDNSSTYTQLDIKNEALHLAKAHQKCLFDQNGDA